MDKEKTTKFLIDKGYKARIIDGLVTIYVDNIQTEIKKIKKILFEIGYNSSWGVLPISRYKFTEGE